MFSSPASSDADAVMTRRSRLEFFHPYAQPPINFLYNLLFCDNLELFRRQDPAAASEPWLGVLGQTPSLEFLEQIALDDAQESRLRALACQRLQAAGRPCASPRLFGVVVEVPMSHGIDVLAAYADGSARYIDQSGRASIFDGAPLRVVALAKNLVAASRSLLERSSQVDRLRMAPPRDDKVRLSLIAPDGLHVVEGRFGALLKDPFSAPIVSGALALLQVAVEPQAR